MYWPIPKDKDVTDRYGASISSEWLDGEAIIAYSMVAESPSDLVITQTVCENNVVSSLISGGYLGFHKVKIRASTPTRQIESSVTLWVKDV